jgi:membrane-associated phospholipid phosphatase
MKYQIVLRIVILILLGPLVLFYMHNLFFMIGDIIQRIDAVIYDKYITVITTIMVLTAMIWILLIANLAIDGGDQ